MINHKGEVIFNTPQWLLDWNAEALRECPDSPSDELRKINEAMIGSEDPMEMGSHIWVEDHEEVLMAQTENDLQIQLAEEHQRQQARNEQRSFVSDEENNEAREESRHAKLAKRKASEPAPGSASRGPYIMPPSEHVVAESSKAGAARRSSAILYSSVAEHSPAGGAKSEVNTIYEAKKLPEWLTSISIISLRGVLKRPDKDRTQALRAILAFKDCVRRCEDAAASAQPESLREKLFEELRDHVHKAEITLKGVDKYVVRKTNILTVENGLPKIFTAQKVNYPWDLKADAWQLYLRWYKEDFKPDLLRGIITRKGKERNKDSIDPEWMKNPSLKISANYHGEGNLVLGQWWPTQLCALRDGAHGSSQGGIWGEKGKGTYSIVLSSGGYKDKDNGDEIWYSGTESKTKEPTEFTMRMIEAYEEFPDRAIRVLRSSALSQKNPYRPKCGLRYDGLYRVVGMELIGKEKALYLFKLVRCENQNPIRCENNAARRPTKYEEAEFARLRDDGR